MSSDSLVPAPRKRKRSGQQAAETEKQGLASKLHHAQATIARAAKKAKTFETQKLVRKIKTSATPIEGSKGKPITAEQLSELQDILSELKTLQVEALAAHALRSRLAKDKAGLASNEDVVAFCSKMSEHKSIDPTSAEGKAQNRVLASKAMADALSEAITGLRKRAGIAQKAESGVKAKPDTKGKGRAETLLEPAKAKKPEKPVRRTRASSEASTSTSESESDSESVSGLESDESDATVSHISAEDLPPGAEEEFAGIDDSDVESVASDSSFPIAALSKKAKKGDQKPSKLDKKAKAALDRAPPTTSAFLPSLAGGYTVGDPDGSVYSYSGDEGPASIKPERKNRRGQRARQAIWEKKYGKSANHVLKRKKMEAETEENRKRTRAEKEIEALKKSGRYIYGLDSNLTSVAPGKQQRSWAAPKEGEGADSTSTGADHSQLDVKTKKAPPADAALHPSWEARKKAKESISTAKPAGKKIVFD